MFAQRGLLGAQGLVVHQFFKAGQASLVREAFELDAADARARVSIVGDHIAAANLQRVHLDGARSQIHQAFGDGAGNRMPDAAVLAGRSFILKNHLQLGAVMLVLVRTAHQIDHLVAFNGAGAREHRERADAREVVHLEGQDLAVIAHSNARLHQVMARMDVAGERLEPVGHKLHRSSQHHGQRHGGKVIRVGMHLDAEGAANVFANHPY